MEKGSGPPTSQNGISPVLFADMLFKKYDLNSDGKLDVANESFLRIQSDNVLKVESRGPLFSDADQFGNGDGFVSEEELINYLDEFDTDNDGELTSFKNIFNSLFRGKSEWSKFDDKYNEKFKYETIEEDSTLETKSKPIFQMIRLEQRLPNVSGTIVDQRTWTDKNGTWTAIYTEVIDVPNEFAEFRLYKFRQDSRMEWNLNELYVDSLSCGEGDIVAQNDSKSLFISDVDANDVGEVMFAYTLNCTYDVSPQRRVLVLIRDSTIHKLVGNTLDFGSPIPDSTDFNLEKYPKNDYGSWFIPITAGRYHDDNNFENIPDAFLVHAHKLWLDMLTRDYEYMEREMNR